MFMLMGNLLMTLVKSYTYWFTHNSKWLPLDKWTSHICSCAHSFFQEHNENYLASFLRSPSTWKKDATITKLGWTTCVTSFYKWMSKNPILPHNSAPIRDRIEILGSTPMFMLMSNLSMTFIKSFTYWLSHNSKWLPHNKWTSHICSCAHPFFQEHNEIYLASFLRSPSAWNKDATITMLGWTKCVTLFWK